VFIPPEMTFKEPSLKFCADNLMQKSTQIDNLIANLEKRINTDSQILFACPDTVYFCRFYQIRVRIKVKAPFGSKQCMIWDALRQPFEQTFSKNPKC